MRSVLTTLGIIIGIAAVIAMMEIGKGVVAPMQKIDRQHGREQPDDLPRAVVRAAASASARAARITLHAGRRRGDPARVPGRQGGRPGRPRPRRRSCYGGKNYYVQSACSGTTPAFLEVRDWTVAEGEPFTDATSAARRRSACIGQTIVTRAVRRRVADRQGGAAAERHRSAWSACSSRKGANMIGSDQDDIAARPVDDVKYRIAGASRRPRVGGRRSVAPRRRARGQLAQQPLPDRRQSRSTRQHRVGQQANTPLPVRFANVDQIIASADVARADPGRRRRRSPPCSASGTASAPDQPDDFTVRDMTELGRHARRDDRADDATCCSSWR